MMARLTSGECRSPFLPLLLSGRGLLWCPPSDDPLPAAPRTVRSPRRYADARQSIDSLRPFCAQSRR